MTTNYTSIKSVLYDLSLMIDERYWNEIKVLEWVSRAVRMLNLTLAYESKIAQLALVDHKVSLPSDLKRLTQVVYLPSYTNDDEFSSINLLDTSFQGWRPMRLTSNDFHQSICTDNALSYCTDCDHEFSVDTNLVLTSTLCSGAIMVAYLAYPLDADGYILIPDDETLKEALLHYVLYRYWMAKYQMKEEGADSRMKTHLEMWNTLSKKSLTLNAPSIHELENIKNRFNRLVPRTNAFSQMFLTLGNRENVNF